MSENRFKVSKADTDGTKETKESYRRVNLSTDIQVNIIEPCTCNMTFSRGNIQNRSRPRVTKIFIILCHTSVHRDYIFQAAFALHVAPAVF